MGNALGYFAICRMPNELMDLVEINSLNSTAPSTTPITIPKEELNKFFIFQEIQEEFLKNIEQAYVLGDTGILVKTDGNVFSVGSNQNGCLGIGIEPSNLLMVRSIVGIGQLARQNVTDFSGWDTPDGDGRRLVAVTASGIAYGWGDNSHGQLGEYLLGKCVTDPVPLTWGPLKGKQLVQVACGEKHTLALTSEGEVYSWGRNSADHVGILYGDDEEYHSTTRITGEIGTKRIKAVTCGQNHSVALSEDGQVYYWGSGYCKNSEESGNNERQDEIWPPIKVNFPSESGTGSVLIKKIVCGAKHTLALSTEEKLYSWGHNDMGQLGLIRPCSFKQSPFLVDGIHGPVTDIGAVGWDNVSLAQTEDERSVYVWGGCPGHGTLCRRAKCKRRIPLLLLVPSIQDAFRVISDIEVSLVTLKAKEIKAQL